MFRKQKAKKTLKLFSLFVIVLSKLISLLIIISVMLFLSSCARDIQNNPKQTETNQGVNHVEDAENDKEPVRINEEVISLLFRAVKSLSGYEENP